MTERRQFARIRLERQIRLKFKGKKHFVNHLLKDISLGGMFIKTHNPMPVGEKFNFEFFVDGDIPPIAGTGIVVRVAKDETGKSLGMGIKFVRLEEDGKNILTELIKKYGKSLA